MTNHSLNKARAEQARRRLTCLANYVYGEGFLPEIAATAAGYTDRHAAIRAARKAGRPELANSLKLPTSTQIMQNRIEDLEFCLDHGEHPERAIRRAGFMHGIQEAQARLRQAGRHDLSARLAEQDFMNAEPCYRDDCQRGNGHTGPHFVQLGATA